MVDDDEVVTADAAVADELAADQGEIKSSVSSAKSQASEQDFVELDQMAKPAVTRDFDYWIENYPYEVACLCFFIGLIIVLFMGKSRNADIAY